VRIGSSVTRRRTVSTVSVLMLIVLIVTVVLARVVTAPAAGRPHGEVTAARSPCAAIRG
jgi:hypothetical protein